MTEASTEVGQEAPAAPAEGVGPSPTAVVDVEEAMRDVIEDQSAQALEGIVDGFRVNWVWMPPWGPEKITDEGKEQLRMLGFNV